ncbi:hypothetical protein GCM10010377_52230 [Streptomyces viridiviolaceus]|nr:hypothetical protein GCM10010377_52230 [Streptomyces viridiviolaceus]
MVAEGGEAHVVGAHGGFEEGELEEGAAERLLLGHRLLVELAKPDGRIVLRLLQGPWQAPVEASLVLDTEYQQLTQRIGEDFVPGA